MSFTDNSYNSSTNYYFIINQIIFFLYYTSHGL